MVSHGGRATSELASLPKGLLCGWVSAGRKRKNDGCGLGTNMHLVGVPSIVSAM